MQPSVILRSTSVRPVAAGPAYMRTVPLATFNTGRSAVPLQAGINGTSTSGSSNRSTSEAVNLNAAVGRCTAGKSEETDPTCAIGGT